MENVEAVFTIGCTTEVIKADFKDRMVCVRADHFFSDYGTY